MPPGLKGGENPLTLPLEASPDSHWRPFCKPKNSCQRTLNLSQWQFITEGVKAKQHNCMKGLCVLDQSKAMVCKAEPFTEVRPNIINITVYSLCCKEVNRK